MMWKKLFVLDKKEEVSSLQKSIETALQTEDQQERLLLVLDNPEVIAQYTKDDELLVNELASDFSLQKKQIFEKIRTN